MVEQHNYAKPFYTEHTHNKLATEYVLLGVLTCSMSLLYLSRAATCAVRLLASAVALSMDLGSGRVSLW